MTYSKIIGTGGYLPKNVVTNFDLEKSIDTTNDWIVERTGIHQRHLGDENDTSLSMSEHATRLALEAAGISASDLGMIIIATTTPEKVFPSTACLLQERLGISGCAAFDLNSTACAGFIYGLSIADQFIRQGTVKYALVIGSELASRVVDWNDRSTCILFGDGAGAVILGASEEPGILSSHLHADGNHKDILYLDSLIGQERTFMKMTGNQLFKIAVNVLSDLFDETLEANSIKKSDIDWLIPHQANLRIIQAMAKKLDLPMDRAVVTLDKQANTSSASIPLALDMAIRDGRVKRGEMLLLEAIGGGLAWGSALIKY
jgi:3-oxoacyl-[acyl-carrier-protein] synthase-3